MSYLDVLVDIVQRSTDDPFFWIANGLGVAMSCYIVYNLWCLKK